MNQREIAEKYYEKIDSLVSKPTSLMEVCGTHTMAIGRFGLRARLPSNLRLISGPGCPVCVTPDSIIDRAIALSLKKGITLATFGDLLRVPGTETSLRIARATNGAKVKIVYSPMDALDFAVQNPNETVVFAGIGFETTAPTIAATVIRAKNANIKNFKVLPAFKLVPPAMKALLDDPKTSINGFICPGHVSAVIGSEPYKFLNVPSVVTGFEALDILQGIVMLLEQLEQGRTEVEIQYQRAVPQKGNPVAVSLLEKVFQVTDASWRGIGTIPKTGLSFKPEYSEFDATSIDVTLPKLKVTACACGEVMRGIITPTSCPLFGKACIPSSPVGPCMVSSEGACAAYYKYGTQ